jgi:hypothetical protein
MCWIHCRKSAEFEREFSRMTAACPLRRAGVHCRSMTDGRPKFPTQADIDMTCRSRCPEGGLGDEQRRNPFTAAPFLDRID